MFDFFSKKSYLNDHLEGAIDIHCHILPGIDDGSPTTVVTQKMLQQYKELGFGEIIATPHIMEAYYENTSASIKNTKSELAHQLPETVGFIKNAAAEYMLDAQFDMLLKKNDLLTLKDNYILIELSYFQKPLQLEEQLFNILQAGYIPVLAHPERYPYFKKPADYYSLIQRGCLLQLNMLSLTSHYGKEVQSKSHKLLDESYIEFIATDAHRPDHLEKIKEIKISGKLEEPIKKIILQTKETFGS